MSYSADYFSSPDVLGCQDLGCADVGIGVYHHDMCGASWDAEEWFAPYSPEDEEMLPADGDR